MSLQKRITVIFIASIFCVVLVQLISFLGLKKVADDRFSNSIISSKTVLWEKVVASSWERMGANVTALTRNRDVTKGLKKNDSNLLSEAIETTYNRLSTSGIVSRLSVTNDAGEIEKTLPDLTNQKRSESIQSLAHEAIQEGTIKSDLIFDEASQAFYSVLIFPLYYRGKAVGSGVYQVELSTLLEDFRATHKSELILFHDGDQIYTSNESISNRYSNSTPFDSIAYYHTATIDSKHYSVVGIPIIDRNSVPIAFLVSFKDRTNSLEKEDNILFAAISIGSLLIALIALGGYLYLGYLFKPLQKSSQQMNKAAELNNLTCRIETKGNDEIGTIANSFNHFVESIEKVIGELTGTTQTLEITSKTVSDIATITHKGATQQDNETQHLAVAMEQMSVSVQEVFQFSQEASASADKANGKAKEGRKDVDSTITCINQLANEVETISNMVLQLDSTSSQIDSVVDSISSIAQQTNLLALNAAIEAARAGEQGRGFAVVADEVRTLASRTHQSTLDIKDMIERLQEESNKAVDAIDSGREHAQLSVEQANRTGHSIEEITRAIAEIAAMNNRIVNAADLQHATSKEMHHNVSGINQISKETAANSQILVDSSKNMMNVVHKVQELIEKFKT